MCEISRVDTPGCPLQLRGNQPVFRGKRSLPWANAPSSSGHGCDAEPISAQTHEATSGMCTVLAPSALLAVTLVTSPLLAVALGRRGSPVERPLVRMRECTLPVARAFPNTPPCQQLRHIYTGSTRCVLVTGRYLMVKRVSPTVSPHDLPVIAAQCRRARPSQ